MPSSIRRDLTRLLDAGAPAADDPDPATVAELTAIIAEAEAGSECAAADLADRFAGLLQFGNRWSARRPRGRTQPDESCRRHPGAAGLTAHLATISDIPTVVIGYDARLNSDVFARDTAAVVTAAGGRAYLPRGHCRPRSWRMPRYLAADAGVMVTASHNPRRTTATRSISPTVLRSFHRPMRSSPTGSPRSLPSPPSRAHLRVGRCSTSLYRDFIVDTTFTARRGQPRDVTIVHTALHGVGSQTLQDAFAANGFPAPIPVAAQAQPDPAFPTVTFPNPEEPGAMDLALDLAEQTVRSRHRQRSRRRPLRRRDPRAGRVAHAAWRRTRCASAPTSSPEAFPRAAGSPTRSSARVFWPPCAPPPGSSRGDPTGFVDLPRPRPRLWRRRALGYCVAPDFRQDKDGDHGGSPPRRTRRDPQTAGSDLQAVLDDLARAHGVHATDAFSVRVADLADIDTIMARLRTEPLTEIAGLSVCRTDDLARGDGGLPPTEGLALPPRRRLPDHRPPVRDRAQAQDLSRGHRAGHRGATGGPGPRSRPVARHTHGDGSRHRALTRPSRPNSAAGKALDIRWYSRAKIPGDTPRAITRGSGHEDQSRLGFGTSAAAALALVAAAAATPASATMAAGGEHGGIRTSPRSDHFRLTARDPADWRPSHPRPQRHGCPHLTVTGRMSGGAATSARRGATYVVPQSVRALVGSTLRPRAVRRDRHRGRGGRTPSR